MTLDQIKSSFAAPTGSADFQRQIEEIEAAIRPLAAKLEILRRHKRDADSREFIAVNRIDRQDVEMSSGDGKPFFGDSYAFGNWLRSHGCKKRWAEWNGRIYHASDLMIGRMGESPGCVEHLPND